MTDGPILVSTYAGLLWAPGNGWTHRWPDHCVLYPPHLRSAVDGQETEQGVAVDLMWKVDSA
jgi:hypothetical protein